MLNNKLIRVFCKLNLLVHKNYISSHLILLLYFPHTVILIDQGTNIIIERIQFMILYLGFSILLIKWLSCSEYIVFLPTVMIYFAPLSLLPLLVSEKISTVFHFSSNLYICISASNFYVSLCLALKYSNKKLLQLWAILIMLSYLLCVEYSSIPICSIEWAFCFCNGFIQ